MTTETTHVAAEHSDTVDYVRLYQSFGLLPEDQRCLAAWVREQNALCGGPVTRPDCDGQI